MKNIKKLLAVLLAALLCVSVTACANNSSSSTAVATLETSSTASEGETAESTDKDPAGYDDDIQGLCKYLEDCKAAAGEKVQMSYDVIGAETAINMYTVTQIPLCSLKCMSSRRSFPRPLRRFWTLCAQTAPLRCWITPFRVIFPTTAASF